LASYARSDTTAYHELLQYVENDATFFAKPHHTYETWVYGYNPKTEQMSSQWKNAAITSAKESEASSVKHQDNTDSFL
jgi:hypothetical protein